MRPRLKLLSNDLADRIIVEARRLLCSKGMTLHHEVLLSRLSDLGCRVDIEKKRVYFTDDIITRSLSTAPRKVVLWNVAGTEPLCTLSGDNVHFTPGSAALYMVDHGATRRRKVVVDDLVRYARMVGQLDHIDYSSTAIVPSDVPAGTEDSFRLYTLMLATNRPVVTGAFTMHGFDVMRDLQLAVRGTREALYAKPFTVFSCCPTSPFKWSDITADNTMKAAELGVPIEFISMPLPGLVSPITLVGSLVQHTAETLSGIVISQTSKPGAPIIYGGAPASFDMRSMTIAMSSIEAQMLECAYAQIGKRLGLPTQAYIGLSDSKMMDAQGGFESGTGTYLAALTGVNSLSGPGMLMFGSSFSLEKLVFDNQVCGTARRLIAGITQIDPFPHDEIFDQLIATRNLLDADHTLQHFRSEHFMPGAPIDRTQPDDTAPAHVSLADRAYNEVERLVAGYQPPNALSTAQVNQLEEVMKAAGGGTVAKSIRMALQCSCG